MVKIRLFVPSCGANSEFFLGPGGILRPQKEAVREKIEMISGGTHKVNGEFSGSEYYLKFISSFLLSLFSFFVSLFLFFTIPGFSL